MGNFSVFIFFLLGLFGSVFSWAGEPAGEWVAPEKSGQAMKHGPTDLRFPQQLEGYRLAGQFRFGQGGGSFMRYEKKEARARADVYLFPLESKLSTVEEKQRRILQEMDTAVRDMESMVKAGQYKDLQVGELSGTEIKLWAQESAPIATRLLTATRLGISDDGSAEASMKLWLGITILGDYLVTIRHLRPEKMGEAGAADLTAFSALMTRVLQDPAMRKDLAGMIERYQKDPLSEEGSLATGAVLAYLKSAPFYPINIPQYPMEEWLAHAEKVTPETAQQLLSAFMLGAAKAAFAEGDASACLEAGAAQFAKVYQLLITKYPDLKKPAMDELVRAVEQGKAGEHLARYQSSKP